MDILLANKFMEMFGLLSSVVSQKLGQENATNVKDTEVLISSFFLLLASIAYGWIGVNFAIDDRKLNKIISPLMLINSLFYMSCIFYAFDFPVIKIIIFLIFSKAFWSISISPFANRYFKERQLFAKLYKLDLVLIIQYAIDNKNLTIEDIKKVELTSESSENIFNVLNFRKEENDIKLKR